MIPVDQLKQNISDEELMAKCNEIIKSLEDYTIAEKYRIVRTLHESFKDACKESGVGFIDIDEVEK